MGWQIECTNANCGKLTWAANIVDLISSHRDENGWFLCSCGQHGYIKKSYVVQEGGGAWEPFLRGIIALGDVGDSYQPFVFLVSYEPCGPVSDVWFSYYKDTRATQGRLKLGHGPGGPPVLGKVGVLNLLAKLRGIGYLSRAEIDGVLVQND